MEDIIWENLLGFMKLLVAIWLLKILINFITIYGVLALGGSGCTGISCARNDTCEAAPTNDISVNITHGRGIFEGVFGGQNRNFLKQGHNLC
jgi:hypothetical protein